MKIENCTSCSGALTRSQYTPGQPADSDLCAACWWAIHEPMPLITLDELDELIAALPKSMIGILIRGLQGGLVDWHGDIGKLTQIQGLLRIQAPMSCAICGGNPITVYAGPGPHSGAWCYVYDENNAWLGDLRDNEYQCETCQAERKAQKEARRLEAEIAERSKK